MSNTSVTFELRGDLLQPGFKTLIWELAVKAGLGGWVTESQDGTYILLRLDGDEDDIRCFIRGSIIMHQNLEYKVCFLHDDSIQTLGNIFFVIVSITNHTYCNLFFHGNPLRRFQRFVYIFS